ncbi:hypothetical protein ACGFX8_11110 [Streptomyces sp. NPDC048362]|uniref:hypothetical protein n=1 Tax=Streptomyces sp. NPDC048362 TaxID=3365539 RepID=UPI003710E9D3
MQNLGSARQLGAYMRPSCSLFPILVPWSLAFDGMRNGGRVSGLQVSVWKRYGHDRLYVNQSDGKKVAWFDRCTGYLELLPTSSGTRCSTPSIPTLQLPLTRCEVGFGDEVRQQLPRVELKVAVTEVVSDPDLAATVQLRLDEARTCYEHGAYTSAVIMLGSLLEGVLAHAAQVRAAGVRMPKPLRNMGLNDFVDCAYENKWIEHDAKLASELVRH